MSTNPYLQNIYGHAGVFPIGEPQSRAKFYTGPVRNGGTSKNSFLKAVLETAPDSACEDLENEALWNTQVRPFMNGNGIRIPRVENHAQGYKWVVFEYLDGKPIPEVDLYSHIEKIAKLCATIYEVPLCREPNGLSGWMKDRIIRFTDARNESQLTIELQKAIHDIVDQLDDSRIQAGMIHGDINLKNLLVGRSLGDDIGLVDSEFGTLTSKPQWDKPRFHDAAYFYHLLHCQFHQPELAEKFKEAFKDEIKLSPEFDAATFEAEFNLSVLERTLSMGNHFPWKQDSNKPIEDPRRLNSQPYVQLIERSVMALS